MNAGCPPGQPAALRLSIPPFIYRSDRTPRAAPGFYLGAPRRNPPAPHSRHPHNTPRALPRPFPGPAEAAEGRAQRRGGLRASRSASRRGPRRRLRPPLVGRPRAGGGGSVPSGASGSGAERGWGLRGELCPTPDSFIPEIGPWE